MVSKSKYFRRFGFELEFSNDYAEFKPVIFDIIKSIYKKNNFIIETGWHKNTDYKKWNFKLDSSTGCELTSPISTYKDFNKIRRVLYQIKQCNPKITKADSVHVHIEAKNIKKHNIIAAWLQIENIILKCFPKHRRNNHYCQKLMLNSSIKRISDLFLKAENESNNHHAILSLNYFDERSTVEFRLSEGSFDYDYIKKWICFCMLFLNYAEKVDPVQVICNNNKLNNLDELIRTIDINDIEIITFLITRYKMFNKTNY